MSGCQESPMLEDVHTVKAITSIEKKKCGRCGPKPINEFYVDKKLKTGLTCYCKACIGDNYKKWRMNNKEHHTEKTKKWQKENPGKRKLIAKKWRDGHIQEQRARGRDNAAKYRTLPKGRLNDSMSSRLNASLRGNKAGRHWEKLVGYTVNDLKRYLEKQFQAGMTWENYGRYGWHIDHIIPISAHNYDSPNDIDFKRCWSLNNLQPLWAKENISKKDKLTKPFQPSLTL